MRNSKIFGYYLIVLFLVSCQNQTKENKEQYGLQLDHVELLRNSIDDQSVYMSADYYLFCKDTMFVIPFKGNDIFINDKKVAGIKSEIRDSLKFFVLHVIYNHEIGSKEFVDLIETQIGADSLYLSGSNHYDNLKIECSSHKGIGYLPPYQPR